MRCTPGTSAARSARSRWTTPRPGAGRPAQLKTLLAIIGPGLIVMVGDNDAGAFATYTQAGQNYGTRLLWTLLLLVPVLYVNQEMVLRLGAVTGVGHARLILERFGKFWGAFSVIDLFLLNALTIVTEFIGISLALGYLGVPQGRRGGAGRRGHHRGGGHRRFPPVRAVRRGACLGQPAAGAGVLHGASAGGADGARLRRPAAAGGAGELATVMLLIIAIVGTTVAPWQLFFQQSYVIDKRITPRFIRYERADLWIGIVLVIVGAVAMMGFTAAAFAGTPRSGTSPTRPGVAAGLAGMSGTRPGVLFAVALIDASVIGAVAVSLSTAYAIGDVLSLRTRCTAGVKEAKGFYARLRWADRARGGARADPRHAARAAHHAVQTLAGVLLPSATVFLLLLCNDKAVLGPWVNGRTLNVFTAAVVVVLVMLSIILTAAVLFPAITAGQILGDRGGAAPPLAAAGYADVRRRRAGPRPSPAPARARPLADAALSCCSGRHVRRPEGWHVRAEALPRGGR